MQPLERSVDAGLHLGKRLGMRSNVVLQRVSSSRVFRPVRLDENNRPNPKCCCQREKARCSFCKKAEADDRITRVRHAPIHKGWVKTKRRG